MAREILEDFEIYLKSEGYSNIYLNYQPFDPDSPSKNRGGVYIFNDPSEPIQAFSQEVDEVIQFVIRGIDKSDTITKAKTMMYLFNSFRGYLNTDSEAVFYYIIGIAVQPRVFGNTGQNNIIEYEFRLNVKYLDKSLNTIQTSKVLT